MKIILHSWLLLVSLSTTLAANDPDLPLCPTNLQFFPQKLPMHCRMPRSADPDAYPDLPQYPTLPPIPESYYQSPSPDKQPPPIPINIPPFPGMPGAMPMPGHMGGPMGGPMAGPMPGMPGMPGAMPMPMPMPMVGGPPHKMPVIVMPFYSQDHSFKKPQPKKPHRKHRDKKKPRKPKTKKYDDSDHDSSSCEESKSESGDRSGSSEHGFWKGRRKARRKMTRRSNKQHRRSESRNKRKDVLTPILQYVTKDGYVIFEKQISKNEAKDWLKTPNEMTEVKQEKHVTKNQEKPEEKHQEDNLFNPKSAEEFFKLDEEDQRMKAMNMKAETEVTTRKGKKQHRTLKFNALINKSNES